MNLIKWNKETKSFSIKEFDDGIRISNKRLYDRLLSYKRQLDNHTNSITDSELNSLYNTLNQYEFNPGLLVDNVLLEIVKAYRDSNSSVYEVLKSHNIIN